ncbi:MAG: tetratricopeptide repeat protein [candidate division WOR-3 bacterium]|nr:MAG: tetratricopeptide repeat protein [candidate division WOR-3 bacterium]
MKSCLLNICALLITTCWLLPADVSVADYYSPENILRFAGYLFEDGDYLRAAGEYQRFLFSFDSIPEQADSILFQIAECYRLTEDYIRAIGQYQKIIDRYPRSRLKDECYYKISLCHMLMGRHDESIHFLYNHLSEPSNSSLSLRIQQLTAANYLFQRRWQAAINLFAIDSAYSKTTSHIINYASQGMQLPRKSSTLAGLYSAIVPGTGKFYCGRTVDGIQSLATVGVLGWQSYTGFRDDGAGSVKGWVFGVIGGIFYLGNIYGSVVAAEIYNEEQAERLLQKVRVFVNVNFN